MRILPVPDELTAPYWAAAREHRLVIQQCECGRLSHPPVAVCPMCHRRRFTWQPMRGYGRVYAFTSVCHAVHPVAVGHTPYVIALIELDEGPRMLTNLRNCAAHDVCVGLPVQVIFEDVSDTLSLPQFTPRRTSGEETP
ncbi:MAG: Zn-ribbon domain-containing OB-fold protein [Solirubrobacteraceae bacterium]